MVDKAPAVKKEAKAPAAKKAPINADLVGQSGVQLGITVKKCQADFGEWYSQVSRALVRIDSLLMMRFRF